MIHVDAYLPRTKINVSHPYDIIKVQKIILHDPGNNWTAEQLIQYFNHPRNVRYGSYHDVLEGDTVYHLIDHKKRAFHAGTKEESELWRDLPRQGWQNAYSLGICMTRPGWCLETLASYVEGLCLLHNLDPFTDVLCHYQIASEKTDPIKLQDNQQLGKLIALIALGQGET